MNITRARVLAAAALSAGSLLPLTSVAIELTDTLSLRGFYTLDATYSDSNNASLPALESPIPLDEGESTTRASILGLQAQYAVSDRLDFTMQVVSTGQTEKQYVPKLEWAYLNYDFGDNLHLRGGKMKLSLLQGIDLRYVGFSRLWVRPLVPGSGAGGFDNYSGADLIKGTTAGGYNLQFQGTWGVADHHLDFIENRDVKLVSGKIEKDGSWLNLALLQARYDIATESGIELKNDASLLMASVETELHMGNTVVNGGYAHGDAEISPDERLAYLSIGYRISNLTPYLLRSRHTMRFDGAEFLAALPPPSGPPPPGPPPPPPRDGTDTTDVIAAGFRYDLAPTYALKLQIDHWKQDANYDSVTGPVKADGNLFTIVFEGVF